MIKRHISKILTAATLAAIFIPLILLYIFVWSYAYVSPTLAEKGLIFKDTINLENYKKVGTKHRIIAQFDMYSRSDRHEVILVRIR